MLDKGSVDPKELVMQINQVQKYFYQSQQECKIDNISIKNLREGPDMMCSKKREWRDNEISDSEIISGGRRPDPTLMCITTTSLATA